MIFMGDPLAAYKTMVVGRTSKDFEVNGKMETSAPLSTKNVVLVYLSVT